MCVLIFKNGSGCKFISGNVCMFTIRKVVLNVCSHFQNEIGCMFTLSKVGLDVYSHFQKWDWMYVDTFKNWIGCMFALSKVGLNVGLHTF